MGAHARPKYGIGAAQSRHRGQAATLFDLDLSATATRAGAVLATGAVAATVVVAGAGGAYAATSRPSATPGTPAQFAALRMCESSGDYSINTGNGYYGAYQFNLSTWDSLGYTGLPSAAAPATQDQAAETLQAERGWEPWPACAAKLGLNATPAPTPAPIPVATVRAALTSTTHFSAILTGAVPAFRGIDFTTALEPQGRSDVRTWQARMVARGWHLSVDGSFGPQSAHIAAQFAAEKGIATAPGTVNAAMWQAAWTAPITP
jgi:hypothetical protein